MLVIGIIAIVLAFLIPALAPNTGRAVEGSTRQLVSDLENARMMAVAERTRTRVLFPSRQTDFSPPPPRDITLRGYTVASVDRTTGVWRQRSKWTRLPAGVAFDSASSIFTASPSPSPTPIVVGGYTYSGKFIEFRPNGSSDLNPAASPTQISIADAFVNGDDTFIPKSQNLRYTVSVDPLSGTALLQ